MLKRAPHCNIAREPESSQTVIQPPPRALLTCRTPSPTSPQYRTLPADTKQHPKAPKSTPKHPKAPQSTSTASEPARPEAKKAAPIQPPTPDKPFYNSQGCASKTSSSVGRSEFGGFWSGLLEGLGVVGLKSLHDKGLLWLPRTHD